jgi:hypothetical protein
MRQRVTKVLLLLSTLLLLCSNALAQSNQLKVTDCRVGTIFVGTSNGDVRLSVHGRMVDLFGRRVEADELIKIVSEGLTPATEQKYQCDDDRFRGAVHLLASVKDARVLGPLLEMTKSSCPHSCSSAVYGLQKLGDKRALPRLIELLRKPSECSWPVVPAIGAVGDETAVKDLIDTITDGGAMDAEARFQAIEEITGLSLQHIRDKWGLLYYGKLAEFHQAMHEWWAANKHLAKIKKTR